MIAQLAIYEERKSYRMTQNDDAMTAAMESAMKEAYIHSTTQEIVQLHREGYNLSDDSFIQYIDEDEEVVYETPVNNQFPVRLEDARNLRTLLSMIYEKSGPLLAEPGGCDLIGNVWIKMRCRAPTGVPGQYVLLTEAVLWIFRLDLKPEHNPIDYIKQKREMAGITQTYPKRWAELHYAATQMQISQRQIHEKVQQQRNQVHKAKETYLEMRHLYVYRATDQHSGQRMELRATHWLEGETD